MSIEADGAILGWFSDERSAYDTEKRHWARTECVKQVQKPFNAAAGFLGDQAGLPKPLHGTKRLTHLLANQRDGGDVKKSRGKFANKENR